MFESKAIGSKADMAANVDISKVYGGYFANPENARLFCKIGLGNALSQLPRKITYLDFGGGQGLLAEPIKRYLEENGHTVRAVVADGNQAFLEKAATIGLETMLCNLEDARMRDTDLITMRAVLHYNPPDKQRQILKAAYEALKDGGYLVHQVSSGSDANSQLRSAIVNIPELGRAGAGSYHWTSIDETVELHKQAGFSTTEVAGFAPSNSWGPEEQWDRFNTKRLEEAHVKNDIGTISQIEAEKTNYLAKASRVIEDFIRRFGEQETGVEKLANGSYLIHYQYPIIVSKK